MCACNLVLPTYYEATHSGGGGHVKWIVSAMISFYHIIPEKWFVLFWMCDFVALTRCCKLVSFLMFYICCFISKFNKAYHMPNIRKVSWTTTLPFSENFLPRPIGFPKTTKLYVPNVKSLAQAVLKIMFCRMPKIVGVTWPKPRSFSEKIICMPARLSQQAIYQIWSP